MSHTKFHAFLPLTLAFSVLSFGCASDQHTPMTPEEASPPQGPADNTAEPAGDSPPNGQPVNTPPAEPPPAPQNDSAPAR